MKAAPGREPFLLSYWYPIDVPSRFAAPIQIFNTCRALVEHGVQVTVYTGRMLSPSIEDCLHFYGISPHTNLRVVSSTSLWPGRRLLALKLKRALADSSRARRHFVVSRGEPGIELFAARSRGRTPSQRNVYEAHRLCYSHIPQRGGAPGRHVAIREPDSVAAAATTRQAAEAWFGRRAGRTWALEKKTVENADGLLCLTIGVRGALEAAFHVTCPVLVLPSGTAVRLQKGRGGLAETGRPNPASVKDIDVLYVGKFERRKGVEDLIEAMRFLAGRRLWMVGGAKPQILELSTLAAERGVADRIVFTGYVEPRCIPALLARARVGVCPLRASESEISMRFTSPLKILEMMAHEVPIVATDAPAVREILQPNRTALLVEPDNPRAIAQALRDLLEQPDLARRLIRQAKVEVGAYSWENRARRLFDFLGSLE